MKFLYFIFFLIFTTKTFSSNLEPLKIYLKKNTNYQDINRSIYILKRCVSLYNFIKNEKFEGYDKKISIRYEKTNNFFLSRLLEKTEKINEKNDNFNENIKKDILKISKVYQEDGLKNFSERKSYFKKSYLFEDLKICSKIQ
jgi:Ni,Fe-hydrogenase I large subunit